MSRPLYIDLSHVAVHQLFTGMSGKGKSTLVRKLVAQHKAPWKFAFESWKREYSRRPPDGLAWPACIDKPSLEKALLSTGRCAFYSGELFPGDKVEGFGFWARWVAEVGKVLPGGKLLVIEEAETTTTHRNSPLHPAFAEIMDELRGAKFDVFMTAQRVSTVSELIRAQTTDIITFQHVDPNQLDWLRAENFDPAAVQKLQRGEYIWRDRETGKVWSNAKRVSGAGASSDASQVAPPYPGRPTGIRRAKAKAPAPFQPRNKLGQFIREPRSSKSA